MLSMSKMLYIKKEVDCGGNYLLSTIHIYVENLKVSGMQVRVETSFILDRNNIKKVRII